MSHVAGKEIKIPEKVEVEIKNGALIVSGPLGVAKRNIDASVGIKIVDRVATINLKDAAANQSLGGTFTSHLSNMIKGVTAGFEKKLIIEGIGFKAQLDGQSLSLIIGLSHPVKLVIPDGLKVKVEKNLITINGYDKEEIGQFSADVRAVKKPEPYKGVGIRYEKEIIRRKSGKKAATAAA